MSESLESRFAAIEAALGYSFSGEIKIGGNYVSVVRHGSHAAVEVDLIAAVE